MNRSLCSIIARVMLTRRVTLLYNRMCKTINLIENETGTRNSLVFQHSQLNTFPGQNYELGQEGQETVLVIYCCVTIHSDI